MTKRRGAVKVVAATIGALGVIIAALIGYQSAREQRDQSILGTAQAIAISTIQANTARQAATNVANVTTSVSAATMTFVPTATIALSPTPSPTVVISGVAQPVAGPMEIHTTTPIPAGTIVVVRVLDRTHKVIDVKPDTLQKDTRFGAQPDGTVLDGWMNYPTLADAEKAACSEANQRLVGSQGSPANWDFGYTVFYQGGPVPATCP